jgi:hypothetical protein
MRPPRNNWRLRRIEHHLYAQHKTQNANTHNRTTQKTNKDEQHGPHKTPRMEIIFPNSYARISYSDLQLHRILSAKPLIQ